ncbi:MAG: c-type cytochrome [Acidobacteria bacterium]|nr:c-type cytochrome [Acidobacteriota bacterium]
MMTNSHTLKVLLAGVCVFGTSYTVAQDPVQGPGKDGRRRQIYAELAKAPEKARSRANPLSSDPDAVAAGKKLFEAHCAECHGDTAEGGKKGPSLRAAEVQQATPGTLFWVLTNGVVRRGMPVWSKLPEPQRWQIVSYIKALEASPNPK